MAEIERRGCRAAEALLGVDTLRGALDDVERAVRAVDVRVGALAASSAPERPVVELVEALCAQLAALPAAPLEIATRARDAAVRLLRRLG